MANKLGKFQLCSTGCCGVTCEDIACDACSSGVASNIAYVTLDGSSIDGTYACEYDNSTVPDPTVALYRCEWLYTFSESPGCDVTEIRVAVSYPKFPRTDRQVIVFVQDGYSDQERVWGKVTNDGYPGCKATTYATTDWNSGYIRGDATCDWSTATCELEFC